MKRITLVLAALLTMLALSATACGSTGTTSNPAADDTGALPVANADDPGDSSILAAVCAPNEPDCEDLVLTVENLDADPFATQIAIHEGVNYSENDVTLFGELVDGSLIMDSTSW